MNILSRLFPPRISLLHATRGRPQQARECRQKWLDAAAKPDRVEHIFAVDADDADSIEKLADLKPHVVTQDGGGCIAAWNLAAAHSSGKILLQLSDDWLPLPGWDDLLVCRIGNVNKSRVLRISDGHRQDDLFCMAILTRARMKQQGWFLPPAYTGIYSDDEFSFRAYQDDVVIDARDLVLTHDHPNYNSAVARDETYQNQNSTERDKAGRKIFLQRNPRAKGHWLHEGKWERFFVPLPHGECWDKKPKKSAQTMH